MAHNRFFVNLHQPLLEKAIFPYLSSQELSLFSATSRFNNRAIPYILKLKIKRKKLMQLLSNMQNAKDTLLEQLFYHPALEKEINHLEIFIKKKAVNNYKAAAIIGILGAAFKSTPLLAISAMLFIVTHVYCCNRIKKSTHCINSLWNLLGKKSNFEAPSLLKKELLQSVSHEGPKTIREQIIKAAKQIHDKIASDLNTLDQQIVTNPVSEAIGDRVQHTPLTNDF